MTRRKRPAETAFVRRQFSPLRILWISRIWVALVLLAFGLALTLWQTSAPPYARFGPLIAGLTIGLWRWPAAASMWRAARFGEVRQASVTGFRQSIVESNGITLVRMTWTDASGIPGNGRLVQRDRLPASGSRIIVYADPKTGRTWWEDDL